MGRIPLPCSSYYSTVAAKKPPENPSRVIDDGSVPSLSPHPTSELLPPAATWSEQGSFVARRLTRPVIQAFLSTQENSASSCHSSSLFQLCSIDVSFFAREFVDKDADDLAGVMVDNAPTLESVKISAISHPLLHTDLTRIVDETEASATHIARRKMFAKKASPITNASISSLRSCDPSVSAATKSTSSKDNDARTSGDGLVDGAAAVSLPDDDGRRCTSPPPRFAAYLGESMSTSGVDALLAAAKRWLMLKAYMSLNTSSALPSVPRPPLLRLVLRNLHIDEKQLYEVGLLEMPAFGQLQLLDLSNNRNIGDEFLSRVLSLVAPAAFPDPLSVNQAKRSRTHGRNDQCATTRISFIPLWQHSPAASPPVSLQALMLCGNKITDHGAYEIQRTFLTDTTSSFNAPCLRLVDVRRNKITGLCKETVLAPISVPSSLCGWSRRVHSSCDQRVRRRIILVWCVMQARALQAVERAKEHRAAQGALEEDSHTKAQQQLLSRRRKRVAQGEAVSDAEHLLYSFASFLSPFNRTHPISVLF
jgi:hypothetical protein